MSRRYIEELEALQTAMYDIVARVGDLEDAVEQITDILEDAASAHLEEDENAEDEIEIDTEDLDNYIEGYIGAREMKQDLLFYIAIGLGVLGTVLGITGLALSLFGG